MKRLSFLIMVMLLVSGLIASSAQAATINVLGSWATGTTHAKEAGTDRALVFIAHGERTGTMNLSAVTYGGQAMTKVVEYNYSAASGYAYAAAFILKEAGVAAASSSTFTVTWSGTAPTETGYSSVFLSNVDQTTATGATGTGGKTSNPVTTSALATSAGDMVLLAATCGNRGSYTLNNSFIEGTDQQMASSTGVTGRKSATGAAETPSATYSSTINRQMIIGLVVKATGGTTPTLSVSPTSVSVAAAAGSTGTFNITSNVSWTVSSNQTWLTASPTSGSNNATVTVTAQANTGSSRTATVTVSGTGVTSQTVTVTQAAAATTSININCGGSATGNFVADQYYSGGSTYTNSNTIDMSQIPTNPPPSAIFNSERYNACTYTIPNLTAGASYTVTLYFAESYVSGSGQRLFNVSINGTSVLSNFDIYASAGGQNKAIARTFTTTANSSGQVVIQLTAGSIQNPKINGISVALSGPTLSVSPTSVSVAAAAGSTGTFNITSNVSWTVSSDQTWLTVSPTSGSNNATVTVTAQQNTGDARTATVTVSGTGVTSQTVTVTQASATAPTLSVSPTSLTVAEAAGSTGTFNVTSNTSWTASSNQTWLSVSPTSGSNNATVTVTAQENTGAQRTATVTVSATGVTPQTVTVTQEGTGGCTVPPMPPYSSLPTNSYLPDPFTMMDDSRITTKAEWTCRAAEIAAQAQEYELGYMQNTPYSATTGAKNGNAIVVTVNDNGKNISFTCNISYPSTGSAPYPAMIGMNGSSLNNSTLSSLGVAVITFPSDTVAQQTDSSSRGKGKFYDMYGSGHSAGALMAWAWGVNRLVDAIEKTPAANIDPTRLGVTGCSRNGKGALIAGCFCDRIKLTIPQESGSGGCASWRVSDWQKAQGQNVQTLSQIVGENVWFRSNFSQFSSTATKLPFDHHMVAALCAPRALLFIENSSMEWLGNVSTWTTGNVAHKVWEALDIPDKMGYSSVGHSDHCTFPSSQQPEVTAYVQKFLVGGGTGNTNVMKCTSGVTYNESQWVNWTVPDLQ